MVTEESTGFVTRVESSSGMIEVNLTKAIQILTCNAIDNIVDQRFGGKAARIFRLLIEPYLYCLEFNKTVPFTDKGFPVYIT